ncbi:MAG: Lrp/AsnC family transcriptional regulator [Eubacteriales bacterium]|nr:Lrp/AsnC family transcriptional regulator [Eubacteriales bacterium]MDD3880958.1 Lrp/AsnC family transcriptional regulator [Eubacteriales bacterium]MDD4511973.1 Lrp/AsnC family transcriptional regulator [Eubacteriales bacterium]
MTENLRIKILEILQDDCRTPLEEIAVMTGSELAQVASEIDAMRHEGVLLRYSAVINWDMVRHDKVEAMIEVRVTPQRDKGFDQIAEYIYNFDEVTSVYLMSGAYDLLLCVEAKTLKELAFFVSGKLSPIENVTGTATHFILKRYKKDGVIFERERRDDRLVIMP